MCQPFQPSNVSLMNNSAVHDRESHADRPVLPLVWRLGLITAGTLLLWVGVIQLTTALWGPEASLPRNVTNAVGVGVPAVAMVLIFRRRVDRRPVSTLGLHTGKRAVRDFLYGALTWLIPAALGLTAALLFGWVDISINSPVVELIGVVLLLIVLVFVYEAFPEELIFRGYIYRNLAATVSPLISVLIQALLFCAFGTALSGIIDGWGASVFLERSSLFFVMGIVIGCLRVMSGSLWAGMGFHVAFQVAMQLALGSSYVDITISDEAVFTLATAGLAFLAATSVAGRLWRRRTNWSTPEPEVNLAAEHLLASGSGDSRQ